ncbi:MAG TPA: transporter substrate-binding domain-containing protein [Azospirillaceae bacterium]|nr:transporter substrate-binding domain-containing protein [Azospirillaceae bacterium]
MRLGRAFARALVLAAALALPAAANSAEPPPAEPLLPEPLLIVGDSAYPPYAYLDRNGEPAGVYVEILREALARLPGHPARIELIPWKRALRAVETGTATAVFPPYRWTEQRPWMEYSEPILTETLVVVCRREVPGLDVRGYPEGFAGLRFVNNLGFLGAGPGLLRMVAAGTVGMVEVPGTPEAVQRLLDGRADCTVNDRLAVEAALASLEVGASAADKLVVAGEVSRADGHLGYRKGDASPAVAAFRTALDQVLRDMKREGRIDALLHRRRPGVALQGR